MPPQNFVHKYFQAKATATIWGVKSRLDQLELKTA